MWPEWMGSKVPPKSAMCRPAAALAPRLAAVFALKFPPRLSRFLRAGSFPRLNARQWRRGGILSALRVSLAFLRGLRRPKPLERVGHATHKFRYALAGGRGDGVKIQLALRAMLAQTFLARAVRGGIELGGHHDHRLVREQRAESGQFAADN